MLAMGKNLQNEEVTEVPARHEALFTELAELLLIELDTSIQSIPNRLHDF